jgi:hypothetical protein
VVELEKTGPKCHSHRTEAGLEDALAVNLDLVRAADELEIESQVLRLRAAQQAEILRLVRKSPTAYDPERPAGARPKGEIK